MKSTPRTGAAVVVAAIVGLLAWWLTAGAGSDEESAPRQPTTTSNSFLPPDAVPTLTATAGTDSVSGLPWATYDELPVEAFETLRAIKAGGPFHYDQDGGTFENREELLPDQPRGYYREYTVETPGSDDRGARRLIAGDGDEYYYTDDHYQSFVRLAG